MSRETGFTITRYGVDVDLSVEGKTQCPRCSFKGGDKSGNNLHRYGLDSNSKTQGSFLLLL